MKEFKTIKGNNIPYKHLVLTLCSHIPHWYCVATSSISVNAIGGLPIQIAYHFFPLFDILTGVAHFHGYKVVNLIERSGSNKSHGFTLQPPMPDMREYYFCAKDDDYKHK